MSQSTILVACHKPTWLYHQGNYLPVHCGRAVHCLNNKDLDWMKSNTMGDDIGDNISHLNPYFCELTALYWAWKNYEYIGSPNYLGLCHYSRYFLDDNITGFDIVAPVYRLAPLSTIKSQYLKFHSDEALEDLVRLMPSNFKLSFCDYLESNVGYFFNMFIAEKNIFFEYCELVFPLLLNQKMLWEKKHKEPYPARLSGFLAERLTGAFLAMKKAEGVRFKETVAVVPWGHSKVVYNWQKIFLRHLSSYPGFFEIYSLGLSAQTHIRRYWRVMNAR